MERLLDQYQTLSRWIARPHKSGNLREEAMSLAQYQVFKEVAGSKGQLGTDTRLSPQYLRMKRSPSRSSNRISQLAFLLT